MTFDSISALASAIDSKLGLTFIEKFQYGRKHLKGASRISSRELFGNRHDDDGWAINKGGGTEVQYHISVRENKIYYGLGFSAQYVEFKNEMSPIDYIKPFTTAFLNKRVEITQILPDYQFVWGSEAEIKNPSYGNFILFGNSVPTKEVNGITELDEDNFEILISDLQKQWPAYELIFKTRNQLFQSMALTATYLELLDIKPQLILQGAPGTGKTFAAQEIAYQKIFGKVMSSNQKQRKIDLIELSESPQYAFVQFHPAYSYEDFIRGISAKPHGDSISYKAEDRSFAKFAALANQNLIDSKKNAADYTQQEWLKGMIDKFRLYIGEKLANTGTIKLTDAAYIDRMNNDTIRYRGTVWQLDGGVPNKDLLEMYQHGTQSLDDIKKLNTLTLSAKSNSTYWLKMLELFKDFISNSGENEPDKQLPVIDEKPYIFVIDEINRANLPAVLGELIYALEYRDIPVGSIYELEDGDNKITIPSNLYVIGTMNTADRSIGHLDYAIRRRFAFADVTADEKIISYSKAKKLFEVVKSIFNNTEGFAYLNADFEAKDVIPGHSYYLTNSDRELELKLTYDIIPILKEYVRDGILTELPETKVKSLYDALI